MRRAGLVIAGLALIAPVVGLVAQSKGTFEIGGFGRYTAHFSNSYYTVDEFRDKLGGGARIGYFIADGFALELDGNANPTDIDQPNNVPGCGASVSCPLLHRNANLRGILNFGGGGLGLMLGAGVGVTKLSKSIDKTAMNVTGLAGFRLRPADWFNIRLEGVIDFIPKGFEDDNTNVAVQLGGSLMFGGCKHDTDMINISPTSATLQPGQSQGFNATAMYCGKDDGVVYRLTGPGTLDSLTGRYTATTPGTAQVTAYSKKGKLMSSANVTVRTPPPPAPAPAPAPAPTPPPAPQPPPRESFELTMVHFRFDRSDLTAGGRDTLIAVANTLKSRPTVNVDVIGHTDWVGTNAYNMMLSQARAETVRRFLMEQGIAESRIMVKWRGEEEPMADNESVAGRALNRRAEVKQNN